MGPSDSLPAPPDFALRAYTVGCTRRRPPGRVSPVPHRTVVTCCRQYPGEGQHAFRNQRAVRGLRRAM